MLRIKPFTALRPPVEHAAEVACVPYDVINTAEARVLAEGKPRSFLHVIRPELGLPDGTDPYSEQVYRAACDNFARFQREGTLKAAPRPGVYLYRQQTTLLGRKVSQTGVVACCHIDDYERGIIKKHEKTRKDKEDDRTRHVLELNANAEPVFFLFKDEPSLAAFIARDAAPSVAPLYDFTAPDGVRHTIWECPEAAAYVSAFKNVPVAYVADGHHRTAAAARAGAEKRAANPGHTGDEGYNWFMAVLFPASQLTILPYHRMVKSLGDLSPSAFVERLGAVGKVESASAAEPGARGSLGVYLGKAHGWKRVTIPADSIPTNDPIASLDYEMLADRILGPILGITDLRTDKRIDFVGGIRGPGELEKRVDSGEMAAGFCMHPVQIEQLIAIADAGAIMPPKSTWFEPKLRSGLLVNPLA
ncbi:MAG: DUF1015 domain-containing protein [Phycisphaerales bacterium]